MPRLKSNINPSGDLTFHINLTSGFIWYPFLRVALFKRREEIFEECRRNRRSRLATAPAETFADLSVLQPVSQWVREGQTRPLPVLYEEFNSDLSATALSGWLRNRAPT
jgi:hypothetical protein